MSPRRRSRPVSPRALDRVVRDVRRAREDATAPLSPRPRPPFDTREWERQHQEAEAATIHNRPLTDDSIDG